MTTGNFPLNRKETFSVSMVIFIGMFYVLSLSSALFQTQSLPVSRVFGLTETKFLLLSFFYGSGAFSFFRLKNRGWVICTATLLNFAVVVFNTVIAISQSHIFDAFAAIAISFFLLLLMAFFFLFNKSTRLKFQVNNKTYLFTIVVYVMMLFITLVV